MPVIHIQKKIKNYKKIQQIIYTAKNLNILNNLRIIIKKIKILNCNYKDNNFLYGLFKRYLVKHPTKIKKWIYIIRSTRKKIK
jgi:hypothetical protein